MTDEIKWYCLKQKNTNKILSRVFNSKINWVILEPTDPILLEKKKFHIAIGCSEDEMKIDYAEEIEKFDLEVVEMIE